MRPKSKGMPGISNQRSTSHWLLALAGWLLFSLLLQASSVLANDDDRPTIPNHSYPDLAGKQHNLQQWKGNVLLLNFWASWCTPCLSEIRHLNRFQHDFAASGLQVVGLGIDDPRKLANVKRSLQIAYPVLRVDEKESRKVLAAWGNKSGMIPFTVIFDKHGRIVSAHRGVIDDQVFNTLVKPLLQSSVE
jgi:peroxiredoxin